jgi:hypothetical protein
MPTFKPIPEYCSLSAGHFFNELVAEQKPIVIRGFTKHWPLVKAAKESPQAFTRYLNQFYGGRKARILLAPPSAKKRFYYNSDMTGVNYITGEERLDLYLGRMLELMDRDVYPAISLQNASPNELLPGLLDENKSSFFDDVSPRLWIGNEGIVSAHYDGSDNLANVVAGRRKFILFPPDQVSNLYPGPLNFSPAGAPTSMVNLNEPDFERYPRYKTALANAYCAELGPGDAIFIPMLWWHHVESLEKVNALMNYWWNGSAAEKSKPPTPIDSLTIALLAMRDLNAEQRKAWSYMFDHYVFNKSGNPAEYIPKERLYLLGKVSDEYADKARQQYGDRLKEA